MIPKITKKIVFHRLSGQRINYMNKTERTIAIEQAKHFNNMSIKYAQEGSRFAKETSKILESLLTPNEMKRKQKLINKNK